MEQAIEIQIKERKKSRRREAALAFGLMSPYLIIFFVYSVVPFVCGFIFSFLKYNPYMPETNEFVGFFNFSMLFDFNNAFTKQFWASFGPMLLYDIIAVPVVIFVPFIMAYFINKRPPGYKIFRAILFLPSVISVTIIGVIFTSLFAGDDTGLINSIFGASVKWLSGKPFQGDTLRWLVILLATIWSSVGMNFIIFSGALRNIPKSLYEACEMDGGGKFRKILSVTVPQMKPQIVICLLNSLISFLNLYGTPVAINDVDNINELVSPMMFIQKYLNGGVQYAQLTGYICASALIFGLFVMIGNILVRKFTGPKKRGNKISADCTAYIKNRMADGASVGAQYFYSPAKETPEKEQKPVSRKYTKSERIRRREKTGAFIFFIIVCAVWLFPLIYMVGTSLKSPNDLMLHPESIFPSSWSEWTLEHYKSIVVNAAGQVEKMPFWLLNSLWSTLATVAIVVILDFITAYAFVFLRFKGKKFLTQFLFLWMAVPSIIGTVPQYAIFSTIRNSLGLSGMPLYFYIYYWLIVPGTAGIFNMILMRNFFESIPKDVVDSAKSDGAGHAKIFFKIVAPLAKSTAMMIILFVFTSVWNSLAWPQLLLSGESEYWHTITIALLSFSGGDAWGSNGLQMATCLFSLIPSVIIFFIAQNKMIDSLASSGVKG